MHRYLSLPIGLCWLLFFLSSCGSTIEAIHSKIDKQIVPVPEVPFTPKEGSLYAMDDGGILYINKKYSEDYLIISRYSSEFTLLWIDSIQMFDRKLERIDWNAIDINTNDITIYSTLTSEVEEEKSSPIKRVGIYQKISTDIEDIPTMQTKQLISSLLPKSDKTDTLKYIVRKVLLKDGSSTEPKYVMTFPVNDEYHHGLQTEIVNTKYGRVGQENTLSAYFTPDKSKFLITTYYNIPDSFDYYLNFSLFTKDLSSLKERTISIRMDSMGEALLGAVATNDGSVIISLFSTQKRTLRCLKYNMSGDGSITTLTYTFPAIEGYDSYSFKFSEASATGNKLYAGICVYDPPGEFFSTGNSDFAAMYFGTIDFDTKNLRFGSYAPTEARLDTLFETDELQNIGIKNMFIDEASGRAVIVLEEFVENMSTHTYTRMVGGGPDAVMRSNPFPKNTGPTLEPRGGYEPVRFETYATGTKSIVYANNIVLLGFDMNENLIWERGIQNSSKSEDDMYLGCYAQITGGNKLNLWYPSDDILRFHSFDAVTGKRISGIDKEKLIKLSGVYYLSPLSLIDNNNRLVFLARDGRFSTDSFLFRLTYQ